MAQLTSHAIVRLRRILAPARDTGAPSPLLIYGNVARTEALARLLGASVPFPAVSAVRIVQDRIDRLRDQGGSAAAAGLTEAARPFPVETFFSGRTVTPGLDEATHRHCLRATGLAAAFAIELGFGDLDGYRLTKAARPHDVGKTKIPLSILNKPGRLTARRPYRPPMSGEVACGILRSMFGSLDPVLVEAFRPVMTAFDPSGAAPACPLDDASPARWRYGDAGPRPRGRPIGSPSMRRQARAR